MNKKDSKLIAEAKDILSHIRGTLIADLKSLKSFAVKLQKKEYKVVEEGGSLNYLFF